MGKVVRYLRRRRIVTAVRRFPVHVVTKETLSFLTNSQIVQISTTYRLKVSNFPLNGFMNFLVVNSQGS